MIISDIHIAAKDILIVGRTQVYDGADFVWVDYRAELSFDGLSSKVDKAAFNKSRRTTHGPLTVRVTRQDDAAS